MEQRRIVNATIVAEALQNLETDESCFDEVEAFIAANLRRRPPAVLPVLSRSQELCKARGYRAAGAATSFWFGWYRHDRGDFERALELHFESLTVFQELQDWHRAVRATLAISADFKYLGLYDIALDWALNARRESERLGNGTRPANIILSVANLLLRFGRIDEASEHLDLAVGLEGTEETAIAIVAARADVALARRDFSAALHLAGSALEQATADGIQNMRANARAQVAKALFGLGREAEAAAAISEAIAEARVFHDARLIAEFLVEKGRIELGRGRGSESRAAFREALRRAEECHLRPVIADAARELASQYEGEGKYALALRTYKRFGEEERAISSARSEYAAALLRSETKATIAASYRDRYERIELIGELGCQLTGCLDLNRILESIYGKVNAILDAPAFGIVLHDTSAKCLRYELLIEKGKRVTISEPISIHDAASFGAWCYNHRKEIVIGDITTEYSRYIQAPLECANVGDPPDEPTRSLMYMPLMAGPHIIGVATVQSYRTDAYTTEDVEAFRTLARYIAIAIENGVMYEQMKSVATMDQLTGTLNRRGLFKTAERELKRARRNSTVLSIAMIDLDHFKDINDNHGHACGDEVLRDFGRLVEGCLRSTDAAGRYGGEEFVLVMPETASSGAVIVAERLRNQLRDYDFCAGAGAPVKLTASFGVAEFEPAHPETSFEDLVAKADAALYRAKEAGRDRVVASTRAPT